MPTSAAQGAGRRYLIQHSAGSGKSNSIGWLVHQLIGLETAGKPIIDSVIVVTDRVILDKQIRDTIKGFAQVGATVGHAQRSGDLRTFIAGGKKIIITTVQKFPFVLDDIGTAHKDRTFAIVIDEAHSSQGGRTAGAMNEALAADGAGDDEESPEDQINRIMAARKMLPNASYFAFTATPKNKTLEIFGEGFDEGGQRKHRPFHSYTMKQAIQEGFILDVLANYTPLQSYYKLISTVESDPEFDTRKAQKKLRKLRREQRPCHPAEGRDHRRPLPRSSDRSAEDRRPGTRHGRDREHRAGAPVLPCHRGLSQGAQEPLPGNRGVLGRARVRRHQGHRGVPQRVPEQRDRRAHPGGPVSAAGLRRQVPNRLRRAVAAFDVRRQAVVAASRRCRRCRGSTARTRRSTTSSSSTS